MSTHAVPGRESTASLVPEPTTGDAAEGVGEGQREIVALARGGMLNLAGNVWTQIVTVGLTLVIARLLGAAALGRYAQAIAVLALLDMLARSGLGSGLVRFIAVGVANRDPAAIRGTARLGVGLATLVSAVLAVALAATAPSLASGVLHDRQLTPLLRWAALTLPFMSFTNAALAATQGFRTMRAAARVGLFIEPGIRLVLTTGLLLAGTGLTTAMSAMVVSNALSAVLAAAALHRLLKRVPPARPRYEPSRLLRFSGVAGAAAFATTGLLWADTLLLGAMRGSSAVGRYNVATRIVVLATFVMPAVTAAFAPRIADLHQRGRTDSLHRSYQAATSWIVRLSLPAFAMLLVFPTDLLRVFGHGYADAAAVTMILAGGKLVDAATGPSGMMLNMSGRPALSVVDNLAVLILNVILNLWLIPRYGVVGAAVAWAVSLALVNGVRVLQVRWTMHVAPFDAGQLKAVVAAAASAGCAALLRGHLPGPERLVVGGLVVAAVYVAAVAGLGVAPEDRLAAAALLRRRVARPTRQGATP